MFINRDIHRKPDFGCIDCFSCNFFRNTTTFAKPRENREDMLCFDVEDQGIAGSFGIGNGLHRAFIWLPAQFIADNRELALGNL